MDNNMGKIAKFFNQLGCRHFWLASGVEYDHHSGLKMSELMYCKKCGKEKVKYFLAPPNEATDDELLHLKK